MEAPMNMAQKRSPTWNKTKKTPKYDGSSEMRVVTITNTGSKRVARTNKRV
jgi:hypothetical protein